MARARARARIFYSRLRSFFSRLSAVSPKVAVTCERYEPKHRLPEYDVFCFTSTILLGIFYTEEL